MLIVNINKGNNNNNNDIVLLLSLDNFTLNVRDHSPIKEDNPINIIILYLIYSYMEKSLGGSKPLQLFHFIDNQQDKLTTNSTSEQDIYSACSINYYKKNIQPMLYKSKNHHNSKASLFYHIIKDLRNIYPDIQYKKTKIVIILQDPYQTLGQCQFTDKYTDYNPNLQDPLLKDMIDYYSPQGCEFLYGIIGTSYQNNLDILRDAKEFKIIYKLYEDMLPTILFIFNIIKDFN